MKLSEMKAKVRMIANDHVCDAQFLLYIGVDRRYVRVAVSQDLESMGHRRSAYLTVPNPAMD
jgi:hypothetical protein